MAKKKEAVKQTKKEVKKVDGKATTRKPVFEELSPEELSTIIGGTFSVARMSW